MHFTEVDFRAACVRFNKKFSAMDSEKKKRLNFKIQVTKITKANFDQISKGTRTGYFLLLAI